MESLVVAVFVLGYAGIAFEHPLKVNKTAIALVTGILCWTLFMLSPPSASLVSSEAWQHFLSMLAIESSPAAVAALETSELHREFVLFEMAEHLAEISQILFFLLGAMTIVELVDSHQGFRFITDRIRTRSPVKLLWMIAWVAFFLSAILDNLTTTIVMATLLRKLIKDRSDLWFFAGFIVIAANAGGAWSPIGDVTTIMLWIGGQITAFHIITAIFLPSLVCILVPLGIAAFFVKGKMNRTEENENNGEFQISEFDRNLVFSMGVGALLFVPIFKSITHLPPFMGILFGLGVLWLTTELLHRKKNTEERHLLSVANTIRKIDTPSVLFFLGILLAVGALQTAGHLTLLAGWLEKTVGDIYVINILIGLLSALVDNVPLVAGAMGMYSLDVYQQDHAF